MFAWCFLASLTSPSAALWPKCGSLHPFRGSCSCRGTGSLSFQPAAAWNVRKQRFFIFVMGCLGGTNVSYCILWVCMWTPPAMWLRHLPGQPVPLLFLRRSFLLISSLVWVQNLLVSPAYFWGSEGLMTENCGLSCRPQSVFSSSCFSMDIWRCLWQASCPANPMYGRILGSVF